MTCVKGHNMSNPAAATSGADTSGISDAAQRSAAISTALAKAMIDAEVVMAPAKSKKQVAGKA